MWTGYIIFPSVTALLTGNRPTCQHLSAESDPMTVFSCYPPPIPTAFSRISRGGGAKFDMQTEKCPRQLRCAQDMQHLWAGHLGPARETQLPVLLGCESWRSYSTAHPGRTLIQGCHSQEGSMVTVFLKDMRQGWA